MSVGIVSHHPAWNGAGARHVYAIFDGARDPAIVPAIERSGLEATCLYAGPLSPRLAAAAPHLVRCPDKGPAVQRLIDPGWGKSWGIVAVTEGSCDFPSARRHLRKFLQVKGPDGKKLVFRYYDPRVLRVFLPTCDAEQLHQFFGPVRSFYAEDSKGEDCIEYRLRGGELETKRHSPQHLMDAASG